MNNYARSLGLSNAELASEYHRLRLLNAELVEVLEELLNLVRDTHEPWQCAWEHARAALAKVKERK